MNCMKCGTEIKGTGVFCEDCLAVMAQYPVKPNITVQFPVRPTTPPVRKKIRRQRGIKPEDQIRHLKKVRNWLCVLLAAALLAFAVSSLMVIHLLSDSGGFDIGQNYETIDSTGET